MLSLKGLNAPTFLAAIDRLLAAPDGVLRIASADLIDLVPSAQMELFIAERVPNKKPSTGEYLLDAVTAGRGGGVGLATVAAKHVYNRVRHANDNRRVLKNLHGFQITRPAQTLTQKEAGLVRAMAALFAGDHITPEEWHRFATRITWGDGRQATIEPGPGIARDAALPEARKMLGELLTGALDSHDAFLADSYTLAARNHTALPDIDRFLSAGARWMRAADISGTSALTFDRTPASLIIGHEEKSGRPLHFSGNESLISIGGPGTGKTECQVIPNLLTYPGSVIVLDVKGELWQKTAAHRQAAFGPVYRFAPTDMSGATHRYNPMDAVSADPGRAAMDCDTLATQLVPPNPSAKEPFWDDRARDYVWGFAMLVALSARGPARTLANVQRCLSVPINMKATAPGFDDTETGLMVRTLKDLGSRHGQPALEAISNDLKGGLGSQTTNSIFEHARKALAIFARSQAMRNAVSATDWRPQAFRDRPGSSLYLCLSGGDIETYAPILRLILQQHADAMLTGFTNRSGQPPVTFMLDEFPQLGPMPAINRMMDMGRGAGVRLWLFAQSLGQLHRAYDRLADGMVGMCRVQSFLRPDRQAADYLSPYLGKTRNLFTGEEQPLAEFHELMGGELADRIVTIAPKPFALTKRYAWQTMSHLIKPPPVLRRTAGP